MNLSPNFTLAELSHTDHRELENVPNEAEIQNLYRLAQFLEQVRDLLARPIMVNSAFRSKAVNDAVGSKDTSQHRLGCAADIRVPGMTPDEVVRAIMGSSLEYDQLIREFATPTGGGWTHVSIPGTPVAVARGQALVIDRLGIRAFA
jgi:hypothetical protein